MKHYLKAFEITLLIAASALLFLIALATFPGVVIGLMSFVFVFVMVLFYLDELKLENQ